MKTDDIKSHNIPFTVEDFEGLFLQYLKRYKHDTSRETTITSFINTCNILFSIKNLGFIDLSAATGVDNIRSISDLSRNRYMGWLFDSGVMSCRSHEKGEKSAVINAMIAFKRVTIKVCYE